ncbi:MAG: ATP-grasp domain-containing protein [Acidimicrobiia bacterium]|nr:ATP-grasp domain-containing protein [Acidimicrobiia bacterium]
MSTTGLILPSSGYRTEDFITAARRLRCDLVVISDEHQILATPDQFMEVDLNEPDASADRIARTFPNLDAIIAADDGGVLLAAKVGELLDLPHNPPAAAAATRDKIAQRMAWQRAGLAQPDFRIVRSADELNTDLPYPVVVKPASRSASEGVIRADDVDALESAYERTRRLVGDSAPLIVETFMPGREVALEALLRQGELTPLSLFDKPDPMDGPYFAETILISPSRLAPHLQRRVKQAAGDACRALGLEEGPVHIEFRVSDDGVPGLIELAARPIGGMCGRAIRFSVLSVPLEEILLRAALGRSIGSIEPSSAATGVYMLNAPQTGTFVNVSGVAQALEVPGIIEVTITAARGSTVTALPDGGSYLGFVFARAATPHAVEVALRAGQSKLRTHITPLSGE